MVPSSILGRSSAFNSWHEEAGDVEEIDGDTDIAMPIASEAISHLASSSQVLYIIAPPAEDEDEPNEHVPLGKHNTL